LFGLCDDSCICARFGFGADKLALISSGAPGPIVESTEADSEPEVTAVDPETLVVELAPSDEVAGVTGVARKIGLQVPAVWVVSEAGTSVFAAAAGLAAGSLLASSSANKRPGTALTQNDTSKSTHIPLIFGPNARMLSCPATYCHREGCVLPGRCGHVRCQSMVEASALRKCKGDIRLVLEEFSALPTSDAAYGNENFPRRSQRHATAGIAKPTGDSWRDFLERDELAWRRLLDEILALRHDRLKRRFRATRQFHDLLRFASQCLHARIVVRDFALPAGLERVHVRENLFHRCDELARSLDVNSFRGIKLIFPVAAVRKVRGVAVQHGLRKFGASHGFQVIQRSFGRFQPGVSLFKGTGPAG
jgi:hypothetical protein